MMDPVKLWVLYFLLFGIAVANAFIFITMGAFLGGVASETRHGHYYLNNHGRFTEVSREVYYFCDVYFWFTWVLIMIGVFVGGRAERLRRELQNYDPITS